MNEVCSCFSNANFSYFKENEKPFDEYKLHTKHEFKSTTDDVLIDTTFAIKMCEYFYNLHMND